MTTRIARWFTVSGFLLAVLLPTVALAEDSLSANGTNRIVLSLLALSGSPAITPTGAETYSASVYIASGSNAGLWYTNSSGIFSATCTYRVTLTAIDQPAGLWGFNLTTGHAHGKSANPAARVCEPKILNPEP